VLALKQMNLHLDEIDSFTYCKCGCGALLGQPREDGFRSNNLTRAGLVKFAAKVGMTLCDFRSFPRFYCPRCEAQVEGKATRCLSCGAALGNLDLIVKKAQCPACKREVDAGGWKVAPELIRDRAAWTWRGPERLLSGLRNEGVEGGT